ncbi:predicted protein [Histoplasma capsulatum G186AR]|uniref:Uncharacterized protein n=1 Tax=Ajellomyces capsulatus (strain G186AR / H82 / ATCC MYA-2454 / RMSCC 2432) TaxID=447093 RepID=C0NXG1_AJECG|nr:uncharacterized protein HCBG_08153 [Histoplasma capsulatum G186AR]EEH04027.1 predicted protein [Histoplasma capsulatum G186AR]
MPLHSNSVMTPNLLNEAGYRRPGFKEWKAECFGKTNTSKNVFVQYIDNDVSFISQWDTPRTKYNVSAVTTPDVERYTPHGGCYGALLPSWNSQTLDRNPLNPYQQFWACQLVTSLP